MAEKADYEVLEAGFIDGTFRAKGATIALSPRQARYLELSGQVGRPTQNAAPSAPQPMPATAPAEPDDQVANQDVEDDPETDLPRPRRRRGL